MAFRTSNDAIVSRSVAPATCSDTTIARSLPERAPPITVGGAIAVAARLVARRAGRRPAPMPQTIIRPAVNAATVQSGGDVDALRHGCFGCEGGEEVVAPSRDEQRQRTSGCGNHQTLGDELLRQSAPARAQRAAQRHLAFAIDGT
jgi:hypothetical protein